MEDNNSNTVKIEVVGPGCASCHQLHEIVKRVVLEIDLKTEITYLSGQEGIERMMKLNVMQAPILVVDGTVAMVGYVPSIQKIKDAILNTATI